MPNGGSAQTCQAHSEIETSNTSERKARAARNNGRAGGRPLGKKKCHGCPNLLALKNKTGFCRTCQRTHEGEWFRRYKPAMIKRLHAAGKPPKEIAQELHVHLATMMTWHEMLKLTPNE